MPGQARLTRLGASCAPSTTSLSAAKEVVDAGLRRHDDGAPLRVSLFAGWYYNAMMRRPDLPAL